MEIASAAGAAFIGGVFVWSGVEHFMKFKILTTQLANRIVAPGPLLAIASTFEIVAGLCLGVGIAKFYAAAILVIFTAIASLLMLDFWRHPRPERDSLRSAFLVNIAVVGGLILAGAS